MPGVFFIPRFELCKDFARNGSPTARRRCGEEFYRTGGVGGKEKSSSSGADFLKTAFTAPGVVGEKNFTDERALHPCSS